MFVTARDRLRRIGVVQSGTIKDAGCPFIPNPRLCAHTWFELLPCLHSPHSQPAGLMKQDLQS